LPAPRLQAYVSHYWLSRGNTAPLCPVLPDGAVDLVFTAGVRDPQAAVYGTATRRTDIALEAGAHYLGVSFRPGQSRHFLDTPARALTDGAAPADDVLRFDPAMMAAGFAGGRREVFALLDAMLERHLSHCPPARLPVDGVIDAIVAARGLLALPDAWAGGFRSPRQLERSFLDNVGVPAKFFAQVVRFRHAAVLVARSALPLAAVAAASGFADQSHMTNAFRRFAGLPPSAWARTNVVFLQDPRQPGAENLLRDQPLAGEEE
jgi:hypothetical protein